MSKQKLAIVSSYHDFCGNASYTKALASALSEHFDVTVLSLNIDLLRKGDKKAAALHIKQMCKDLRTFDCVNIQFEASLFGAKLPLIQKRFFAIAKSCKRLVLTLHRYHGKENYPDSIQFGKTLLEGKMKQFIKTMKLAYAANRYLPLYDKIIQYCKKQDFPIIIHTKRDRDLIKIKFNYENVHDHPLCFYDQTTIKAISDTYTRSDFCKNLMLDESKTYLGIFGFISAYKGYEALIKALKILPDNYELLIFGAQHPHTIKLEESLNAYIESLLDLINEMGLASRVKFYRTISDDDFLKYMLRCDFNVLPYLEVNQGGSAIAALALETNSRTIVSQNLAFF